jgi:hypothetical protein
MPTTFRQRSFAVCALFLLGIIAWWFWPPRPTLVYSGASTLAAEQPAVRPRQPEPIDQDLLEAAELSIDREPVTTAGISLKAGSSVRVQGIIRCRSTLNKSDLVIDTAIGLASAADNWKGWIIEGHQTIEFQYNAGRREIRFDGPWVVPGHVGEFDLRLSFAIQRPRESAIPMRVAFTCPATVGH